MFISTVASVVGIATGLNSLFGDDDGGGGGGGPAGQAAGASSLYYDTLVGIAKEQWQTYKDKVAPLLEQLREKSVTVDRTKELEAQAAGTVKGAYAGQKQALERKIGQFRNPADPGYGASLAPLYGAEASDVARAVTAARTAEQQRVENTNWDRALQSIGAYQGLPQQATAALNAAAAGQGALAGRYTNMQALADQRAAQQAYGGFSLAANAGRWFGGLGGGRQTQAPVEERSIYNAGYDYGGGYDYGTGYGGGNYFDYPEGAHGGVVTRRGFRRYAEGGPVDGPGTGRSDSIATRKRPGTFIVSADAVRAVGEQKMRQIMEKAGVRPGDGETRDGGGTPVRLSNGEWAMPPEVVQYHGEEFFRKMQQKYHRPLASDDGMANGGIVGRRQLPDSVERAIFGHMPSHAIGRSRRMH